MKTEPTIYEDYRGHTIILESSEGLAKHILTDMVIPCIIMTLNEWNIDLFKSVCDIYIDNLQAEKNEKWRDNYFKTCTCKGFYKPNDCPVHGK